jgi:hypothetical protein
MYLKMALSAFNKTVLGACGAKKRSNCGVTLHALLSGKIFIFVGIRGGGDILILFN